mgnify:CR=1 FL=1
MPQSNPYCCPKCDGLASPLDYEYSSDQPIASYLLDGDRLVIPIVKYRPISCCGKWFNAPYHKSGPEYYEAIRDKMAFFAPTTDWVKDLFRDGEMKVGREKIYLNPKVEDVTKLSASKQAILDGDEEDEE